VTKDYLAERSQYRLTGVPKTRFRHRQKTTNSSWYSCEDRFELLWL